MKSPTESRILVLGLARNVEKSIDREVERIFAALQSFKLIRFIVLESDSDDQTVRHLSDLKAVFPNFEFATLGNLSSKLPNRIERISYCRNELQKLARGYENQCDFVMVADLDGVNLLLNSDAVMSCWENNEWDVVTANQLYYYYDIYALRHPDISPDDCWQYYAELRQSGLHPMKARQKAVFSRQRRLSLNSDWLEVNSAFGGLAIYKRESFFSASYSSFDSNNELTCEHVPFHASIRLAGSKIFINPKLINSVGINKRSLRYILSYLIKYFISSFFPKIFVRKFGE